MNKSLLWRTSPRLQAYPRDDASTGVRPGRSCRVQKSGSRGADVLMNDTAETGPNASVSRCGGRCRRQACRRSREGQRAMRSVPVVVIDEPLQDVFKMLLVD